MNDTYWKSSFAKLRSTHWLALMGMTTALKIVLSYFSIPVGENLHITMNFLIVALEGALYGPGAGMVLGAVTDIVSFMIHPDGAFFFGYTITAAVTELVYGLFFYRIETISWQRILVCKLVVNYGIHVLLNSVWSAMLYSKGYLYYAFNSLIKNTVLLPLEVFLIWLLFRKLLPYLKTKQKA